MSSLYRLCRPSSAVADCRRIPAGLASAFTCGRVNAELPVYRTETLDDVLSFLLSV
jgi:hypothetical protein